jgi:hypothetical protein
MQWQYKVEMVTRAQRREQVTDDVQRLLDRFGLDGWELVTTYHAVPEPDMLDEGVFLIFKRPQP